MGSDPSYLALVIATMAGIFSARNETAQEFIDAAVEVKLLEESQSAPVLDISEVIISERANIKEAMERQSLASEVLPSLVYFDVTVELRLGFESNEIKRVVPIAVAHIDTDAFLQEVWLQITKPQVETMIDKLRESLERMELAESWAKKPSKGD